MSSAEAADVAATDYEAEISVERGPSQTPTY